MLSLQIDMYPYLANAHDVTSTIKIYDIPEMHFWSYVHMLPLFRYTLFGCDLSLEVWRKLGLEDKIDGMLVDRAGSAVLEELIVNQPV
jgi:hypothetical protein